MKTLAFLPLTLMLILASLWSILKRTYEAIMDMLFMSWIDIQENWISYKRTLKDL